MNSSVLEVGTKVHEELLEMERQANLPVSKIKPTPQVGDVLWVKHAVKRDKSGATVLGLMRNDKPERTIITAVMLCGAVRNNHSDVWECKPSKLGNWETINPDRVEK